MTTYSSLSEAPRRIVLVDPATNADYAASGGGGGGGDASAANQTTQITAEQAILAKIIAAPATEAKQDTLIAKDFATQTTLSALSAKVPAALGQTTMANSMSVSVASNQSTLPVAGNLITVTTELTRPSDATAYTAGDMLSNSTSTTVPITLSSIMRVSGGSGYIVGIRVSTNLKSITPRLRVHFFNANNATLSADNAPYKELYADGSKRLGYYDLGAMTTEADSTNSDMSRTFDQTMRIPIVAADSNLYAVLVPLDAFTPASGQKFSLSVTVDNN